MLARGHLEFSENLAIRAQQSSGTGLCGGVDSKYVQIAGIRLTERAGALIAIVTDLNKRSITGVRR
jgi:hypothetical protein